MGKSDADRQTSWMRLESLLYALRLLGAPFSSPLQMVSNVALPLLLLLRSFHRSSHCLPSLHSNFLPSCCWAAIARLFAMTTACSSASSTIASRASMIPISSTPSRLSSSASARTAASPSYRTLNLSVRPLKLNHTQKSSFSCTPRFPLS